MRAEGYQPYTTASALHRSPISQPSTHKACVPRQRARGRWRACAGGGARTHCSIMCGRAWIPWRLKSSAADEEQFLEQRRLRTDAKLCFRLLHQGKEVDECTTVPHSGCRAYLAQVLVFFLCMPSRCTTGLICGIFARLLRSSSALLWQRRLSATCDRLPFNQSSKQTGPCGSEWQPFRCPLA